MQNPQLGQVIASDRVAIFDVDDTLILWNHTNTPEKTLPVVTINGREFHVHTKHLQKIHDYHTMRYHIIVWSNSGYQWASTVCKALGILDKVCVMSKPHRMFDDAKDLKDTIRHGWLEPTYIQTAPTIKSDSV